MEKLKPCPFCGSDVIFTAHSHSNVRVESFVHCDNCTARVYFNEDESPHEVWNRRTPHKWPTYQQIMDASEDYSFDAVDGENAIEWLKSFVEKGQGE